MVVAALDCAIGATGLAGGIDQRIGVGAFYLRYILGR